MGIASQEAAHCDRLASRPGPIGTKPIEREFVLAGDAIFTIEVGSRGHSDEPRAPHYTYRVQRVEANDRYPESFFVKLLCGPDNTSDYKYLGKLDPFTSETKATAKSCRAADSFELRLLNKVLARVWSGDHAAYEAHGYRTHHEGRCGRCGRTLTVPSSVESGIGPECRKKM